MLMNAVYRIAIRFATIPDRDPAAFAVSALAPRMLLTFGIAPPPDMPGCQTIAIDAPAIDDGPPSRTLAEFLAAKIRWNVVISRKRRPCYFDVAIIGPDYKLGARRRILSFLKATAHSRSVVVLLRRETKLPLRSIRQGARGIADAFAGLEMVAVAAPRPAIVIGDLDLAVPRRRRRVGKSLAGTSERALADFLARHRIERSPISPSAATPPGAPGDAGGLVRPRYSEIGRAKKLLTKPPGSNQRALGRWWGNDLALLPVAVHGFDEVGFLPDNVPTQGYLFDSAGRPLAHSFLWELGFGTDLARASLENPSTCVRGRDERWHPLQDAKSLLSGRHHAGSFYLLGLLDDRFGHFLVENLPRAWALDWALENDMRILLWGNVRPFHRAALSLLGIAEDRIEIAEPGATYERVYSPDPSFRMMGSISPVAARVWRRLAAAVFSDTPYQAAPEPFLYLSRAGVRNRRLANEAELEELLRSRGGRILRPETISFADQIRAVACARSVVGCFGSQLHLAMFQPPGARKLVIGGEQFLGPDETLISIAAGTVVDYYAEPVPRRHSSHARTAPWSINLDRFAPAFDRWLDEAHDLSVEDGVVAEGTDRFE